MTEEQIKELDHRRSIKSKLSNFDFKVQEEMKSLTTHNLCRGKELNRCLDELKHDINQSLSKCDSEINKIIKSI